MGADSYPQRQGILVLGMHRSGTSATSGVLAELGVRPPATLMKAASDNPLGFWESPEIVAFHERLLASLGGGWSDWSEIDEALLQSPPAAEQIAQLPDLIEREFGDAALFFVKDPRMCRFPRIWLEALARKDIEAKAVIPVRHPDEVARSLGARNHLGIVHSRLAWLRHMLDAERGTRGIRRTFVPYEGLLADWRIEVERMRADLSLEWPVPVAGAAASIDGFLRADLRHFSEEAGVAVAGRLDRWVADAYAILREAAGKEEAGALERLDDIRSEFNPAAATFAPAFREAMVAHAETVASLRKQVAAKPKPGPSLPDIVSGVEKKLFELESRAKAENASHRSEVARLVGAMRKDAEQRDVVLVTLAQELESKREAACDLESRLREKIAELVALRRRFDQSNELYRQQSTRRKAIVAELEALAGDQRAELDSRAEELRIARRDKYKLEFEVDRLKAAGAKDRQSAERLARELDVVRKSGSWKIVSALARLTGRRRLGAKAVAETAADVEAIGQSALFDRAWYLEHYPDVAKGGMDPAEHYLHFGAAEMRDPGPGFDTRAYLESHPDVKAAGSNPLLHYIRSGAREGEEARDGGSR